MAKYQGYFVVAVVVLLVIAAGMKWGPRAESPRAESPAAQSSAVTRVLLQIAPKRAKDWPDDPDRRRDMMTAVRRTLQKRLEGFKGIDSNVTVRNPEAAFPEIVVELEGVENCSEVLKRMTSTATVEFFYLKNVQNSKNPMSEWRMEVPRSAGDPYVFTNSRGTSIDSVLQPQEVMNRIVKADENLPILTGKDLLPNARADVSRNYVVISIQFDREGADVFRDFTRAHVDEHLAVFFDGKLLTAPVINEPISGGRAEISGFKGIAEARKVAELLNAGTLPVPLKVVSTDPQTRP